MSEVIRVPVDVLLRAGLNLEGVPSVDGHVGFERSMRCTSDVRLRRRLDHRYWKKVRAARRRNAGRSLPALRTKLAPPQQKFLHFMTAERPVTRELARAALETAAYEDNALPASRAAAAAETMRRIAMVKHQGATFLVSTLEAGRPQIFAQVSAGLAANVEESLTEALFWGEFVLELFTGLLTVMGVKIRRRIDMGRWIERIVGIINGNPRLRRLCLGLATKGKKVGVKDLFDLLYWLWMDGFTWECLKDAAGDLIDVSFWGIIHLLGKFAARLSPGAGQALLIADLGLILVELIRKLVTR